MKIRFIIISLIVLLLGGWGYTAYKFEKQSQEDIVAILDNFKEYVSYDSIKINKYGFSVTLNKVMFKPLDFYYDEIVIRHIPFLNITKIDSYGNDVKIVTAENEENIWYSPDHRTTIWFRKSLFNRLPSYWQLSINDDNSTLYNSRYTEKLTESKGSNIMVTNNKTPDNLNLLNLDVKSETSFIAENYIRDFNNRIFKLLKNKIAGDIDLGTFEYDLGKLDILNLPISYNYKLKLKYSDELLALNKLFFQSFSPSMKQDEVIHNVIFMQIANEIYRGKPFLFTADFERKGKIESNFYKLSIEKDKIFDFAFNIKSTQQPSETYEKVGIEALGSYFSSGLNKRAESDSNFRLVEPITLEDGKKIMNFPTKINNLEFNLQGEFDPKEHKLQGKTNLIADDFNFVVDVNVPNLDNPMNAESHIVLSSPYTIINNVVNYIDNAVVPVLNKIEDSREFALGLKEQMSIVDKYGFRAIQAFSKNSELKENDSLTIDIKGVDGSFTINEKTIDQILSDERVIEFIKAMGRINIKSEPKDRK